MTRRKELSAKTGTRAAVSGKGHEKVMGPYSGYSFFLPVVYEYLFLRFPCSITHITTHNIKSDTHFSQLVLISGHVQPEGL
jgi:hypothetical protein